MGFLSKIAVVGAAVSFAKSQQGKQMIAEVRQRFDTPGNRDKAKQGAQQAAQVVKEQLQNRKQAG